jgi:hypothetical protein
VEPAGPSLTVRAFTAGEPRSARPTASSERGAGGVTPPGSQSSPVASSTGSPSERSVSAPAAWESATCRRLARPFHRVVVCFEAGSMTANGRIACPPLRAAICRAPGTGKAMLGNAVDNSGSANIANRTISQASCRAELWRTRRAHRAKTTADASKHVFSEASTASTNQRSASSDTG